MSTTPAADDDGALVIDSACQIGDTWDRYSIRLLDGAGAAIPMTGATGAGEVYDARDGSLLATLTVEVDEDSYWSWRLEAEQTADIPPVTAVYRVWVTLPGGDVTTIAKGRLRFKGVR